MLTDLNALNAEQHRIALLREAEAARLAARVRESRRWRRWMGDHLVQLGESLRAERPRGHARVT